MTKVYKGDTKAVVAQHFACIVSRFNEEITQNLLQGALEGFVESGVQEANIDIVHVPGAFEIPIVLQRLLAIGNYSGIVVLSAVVKGDTDHDQYVAGALTDSVSQLSLRFNTPVAYGVITAKTWRQALDRSGGKYGNRGKDAALTCLEMANLLKKIQKEQ